MLLLLFVRLCRFGQSGSSRGAGDDEPPDDEDEDEGEDDEQRDDEDDEGRQGDDDADEEEADEENDEKRSELHTPQTSHSMQVAQPQQQRQQQTGRAVDDVTGQLMSLSLSAEHSRAPYVAPTAPQQFHRVHEDSVPSSAEKERDDQRSEHKQLQLPHATPRSSSTPPLFFIPADSNAAHSVTLHGQPYRRYSLDSSSASQIGHQQRLTTQHRHQQRDDYSYSPSAHLSRRKDSQSGTESGGSGSKNSQVSSASAALSSSSESSTSSSTSSSSAASSSSSSAASSSPASLHHTPTRTSPAGTQRSLATTAQRTAAEGGRKQKRRASSHDASPTAAAPTASAEVSTALEQNKASSALPSSFPSDSLSSQTPSAAGFHTSGSLTAVVSFGESGAMLGGKSRSVRQLQLDKAPPAAAVGTAAADTEPAEAKERSQQEHYAGELGSEQ